MNKKKLKNDWKKMIIMKMEKEGKSLKDIGVCYGGMNELKVLEIERG